MPNEEDLEEQLQAVKEMLGYEDGEFGTSHAALRHDRDAIHSRLKGHARARAAGVE